MPSVLRRQPRAGGLGPAAPAAARHRPGATCSPPPPPAGDTRPCARLARAARGATLLIHEATFEPALQREAERKRHSTSAEALQLAASCGAYRTLLTHFSQRYPKYPAGLGEPLAAGWAARPAVAFDGMYLPLCALPLLPALAPGVAYALGQAEAEVEAEGQGQGQGEAA